MLRSCEITAFGRLGLCLALWMLASARESHAQNLVGKRVTVIHWGAEFHGQDDSVIGSSEIGKTYEVYAVKGKKLFIRESDGYLLRADVVPYETADKHFTLLVKRKPTADTYYDRGCFLECEDKIDEALKDYNEVLRRNPKHADGYNARAGIWSQKGEFDKSIEDYSHVLRLDPMHYFAYSNRGTVWVSKGDDDKALSDFNDAIRIEPNHAHAYVNRAAIWQKRREFDKAIEDYGEALRLDPSNFAPLLARGILWRQKGDLKNAAADFNELIRRDPKNENAYLYRAAVWIDEGAYISAATDYEQLIKTHPESQDAYIALVQLRACGPDANVRDGKRAMELVDKLKELVDWENSTVYHELLAMTYAEQGEFEKAVEWQSKIVPRMPDKLKPDAEARLKLYQARMPFRMPIKKPVKSDPEN